MRTITFTNELIQDCKAIMGLDLRDLLIGILKDEFKEPFNTIKIRGNVTDFDLQFLADIVNLEFRDIGINIKVIRE